MKSSCLILLSLLLLTFYGCPLQSDYSGSYCINATDHELILKQTLKKVDFTLIADQMTLTGSGNVDGQTMALSTTVENQLIELKLLFAKDGKSFTGELIVAGNSTPYNGIMGKCTDTYPIEEITLTSPYVQYTDMKSIHKGFGCAPGNPFTDHSGLDVIPSGNLMPFRAMSSGKVVEISSNRMSNNLWVTNVVIKYNATYKILYGFENLTSDTVDRDIQLDNLLVTLGQKVQQGEVIGKLHTVPGTYYHVHISLMKNGERVCPAPYMSSSLISRIESLIKMAYPTENYQMCYSCSGQ